ncbi:MAG TPA: HmuY family protein [candidate division Zixibacteria bacterium]|nr:HmuY family protein [candidate division Zixibacteria bacterium]MDD4917208.1 HmuY family protein [candidate division Zixibacteria bacterium]MDM7971674.1 HmuY family protein [candidate division Zixibacteria bacterium]HOD67509.1 HmuY family protein [candidate division Zixibacteria bacterium]HOZ08500.1 HmuY family protein [candidate division Zixibacteria bacterium]
MKKALTFGGLILVLMALAGCEDDDPVYDPIPQPPQGVFSITGDGWVDLWWMYPYDRDIKEFLVYRAEAPMDEPPEEYTLQFRVPAVDNPELNLVWDSTRDNSVDNGKTYWYALATVDHAGRVSDLSAEPVFDTPRPEGVVTLRDYALDVNNAGFDFNGKNVVSAGSPSADVWIDSFDGILYLNAGDTLGTRYTDIQDMGFTGSWDVIGWAPTDGWSNLGWAEIIIGHTYIIWTDDEHFAKLRVISVDGVTGTVMFQWAWQPQVNNPELIAPHGGATEMTAGRPAM